MNTLPLDCLVANFLACEGRLDSPPTPDEENVFPLPLDDTHWLGVQMSESENDLLFFAHPGPEAFPQSPPQIDAELSEELELGDDMDGRWVLTANRSSGRYTLWVSVEHERVGHVEFARIVDNLRWRFAMWDDVLAERNNPSQAVTQEFR
ncbi:MULTISPECIES: hypothetical protein [unclassified Variovorax]|uniref:hypothetical protein n=1 Tax=unclassified Variovorax TaxID=663243 RepID=UPI0008386B9D|nr:MULTISPECIES: hypothetical protein [unclassified Variovorax]PNG59821.1 hypothetical protein CHC07_01550 [Variovorax sp. B4]PNG60388.1 hypothetical protein CHC06_00285 [Variovorax sp. B2]VTV13750.1 hypothetical protein WDL1CHR_04386 [Variovorax sp. WDL1]